MERGVDLRRGRSAQDVRAELDDVVAARLLEVAALPDDPDVLVPGVLGKARPVGNVVPIRAFDVWAHEQDVRRAVGLDQRLTGPAAQAARDRILMALPDVLSESGLHQGSTVRWVVTGPLEFEAALRVTDDGAVPLEDAPSDVTMVMDWATFALLACGRAAPSKVRVAVEGDVAMAERVLDAMPITP
jgi:uncharacterized protein (TIGR03083 family)